MKIATKETQRIPERFFDWVAAFQARKKWPRKIFILPTFYGFCFAVAIIVMLIASINYQRNLGYLLTFLSASTALTAMVQTYRNIAGIRVVVKKNSDSFAGQRVYIPVEVTSDYKIWQAAVHVEWEKHGDTVVNLQNEKITNNIDVKINKRGVYSISRVRVWSRFPLGLFYAWMWLPANQEVWVYPKPCEHELLEADMPSEQEGGTPSLLPDDFSGLKRYVLGDSPRHIAWRLFAQGKGLFTKHFTSETSNEVWLDWASLGNKTVEEKLSILCYWACQCDENGIPFGMSLPGKRLEVNSGPRHLEDVLRTLTVFEG